MPDLDEYIAQAKRITRAYRLHYVPPRMTAALRTTRPVADVVFIQHPVWRGWILEAICREVAERTAGRTLFHFSTTNVPPAHSYFISHQSLVAPVLLSNPCVWRGRRIGFYTHPSELPVSPGQFIYGLNQLHGVLFMCSTFREQMIEQGLARDKTDVVLAGADPARFNPPARRGATVGLSMAYYPRKNPERLVELTSLLAPRRVLLLGRGWSNYPHFDRLLIQPNFRYIEAPYDHYPRHYAEMAAFVSLAQLEGGPIPLIEAMMCNVPPVASRTGFAPDLIRHGENGFLFDVDSPARDIATLVERACDTRLDTRASVAHLTWDRFASRVQGWLRAPTSPSSESDC
jgi:glycosyltransferase involved in cell wall biosynthesis